MRVLSSSMVVRVAVVVAFAVLCLNWPARVEAQGEGDLGKQLITLTKEPTSRKDSGGWTVFVEAKAPLLPAGTKVRFILTWMSQKIETFTVEVEGSKTIREQFKVKKAPISMTPFQFRTEVHGGKDQSKRVRDAMKRDPDTFPPSLDPWTDYHSKFKFQIASQEEIDAALKTTRAFFKERYMTLGKLDTKVQKDFKKAKEGEAFSKNEEFDGTKWNKFIDKEVLGVIGPMQEEILGKIKEEEFRPFRRTLMELVEIANAVAYRSTKASIDLHKHFGGAAPDAHVKPEKVNTKTRRRNPKSGYLEGLVKSINQQLGIGKKKPEAKDKKDDPKKDVGKKEGT